MAPLLSHLGRLISRSSGLSSQTSNALAARSTAILDQGGLGVTAPESLPNKFIFVLLGLIGASFIITGIWFFFRAKNGGFYFHENDWEDYKTTVLRRKGPNGTTLSGATESTNLGGGSVVHGEKSKSRWGKKHKRSGKSKKEEARYKDINDEESSIGTRTETTSAWGGFKKKRAEKKSKKSALREADSMATESVIGDGEESEVDMGVRDALRTYRHEKPARVGGLNKQSDASAWDGSTNDGSSAATELLPKKKESRIRKEKTKKATGGIRKVVSTSIPASSVSGYTSATEERSEYIRAEAKKLQDKGRAAQRRDFSFQAGDDNSTVVSSEQAEREERREKRRSERRKSQSPVKRHPGAFTESDVGGSEVSGDTGHKSYPCHIPGLSAERDNGVSVVDYADERRKKREGRAVAGYRRD